MCIYLFIYFCCFKFTYFELEYNCFTILCWFLPYISMGFPVAQMVKNLLAMQETWVRSLGREDPLEKGIATQAVFLPGESHGHRNIAGCSPWDGKEAAMTERVTLSFFSFIST